MNPGSLWEVQIHDAVEPLEMEWRALEARGACTAFQGFDWARIWYQAVTRHGAAEPLIVTARQPGGSRIDVILPLCRTRCRGYWEVAFADMGVSDFVGPVFDPESLRSAADMESLMAAVTAALPKADVWRIDKIPADIGAVRNPLMSLPGLAEFPVGLWGIALSAGQRGERPPHANRRVFNKTVRRRDELGQKFERTVEWVLDADRLASAFDELVGLRIARFDALGRPEILKDPVWHDFYHGLAAHSGGGLRVAVITLKADGQTIAALLGVGHRGAFHYLMAGFAMEEWADYMPGLQLVFDVMGECPERGFDYLDLTIGDERYKKDVGATRRPLYETRVPVTLKGWLICRAWRLKIALRNYPRLTALLKRLAGRPLMAQSAAGATG